MLEKDFFNNFTHSATVARLLLAKAHDQGNLIEGIILYASSIDAFLRNLIAIKTGIRKDAHTVSLDLRYFYHDPSKWMNERNIYQQALDCGVINTAEHKELEKLYLFRNRVVHRFIISNITYAEIAPRLEKYEKIFDKLYKQLKALEGSPEVSEKERKDIYRGIYKKFGL